MSQQFHPSGATGKSCVLECGDVTVTLLHDVVGHKTEHGTIQLEFFLL